MTKVYVNITANFSGSLLTAIIGLASIPLYLHFLGVGAYALVAIFGTLLSIFAVLDMGLIQTLSRELARLVVIPNMVYKMRSLVRTLEILYILMGLVIGFLVIIFAPWLADEWIRTQTLSNQSVLVAVQLMGLMIAVQWPIGLYAGGLIGLEQQLILNILNVAMALIRLVASVLTLWLWQSTIEIFFLVQFIVSGLHVCVIRQVLWKKLPKSILGQDFSLTLIGGIKNFAAGVAISSLIASLLLQLDKIILTRMLSLELFGYYAIANIVSMNLYRLFGPIYSSVYPRLVNLVASNSENELITFYHKSAQLIAVFIFPATAVLILFSYEIVNIWLQDSSLAKNVAPIASILLIGTMLNGVMHIPYGLQLSAGWTSLGVIFGSISIGVFAILLIVLTHHYGIEGAAMAWPIQQGLYFIFTIPIMHHRLLVGQMWKWYLIDVLYPFLLSFAPVLVMWKFKPILNGSINTIIYILIALLISYLFLFTFHLEIRREALQFFRKRFGINWI